MKHQINSWLDGSVLFECEAETQKEAMAKAVDTRADLTGADLADADLADADLTGADLTRADLTGADLTGADLTGADLTGADLTGADLTDANLTDANLTGADLAGANLGSETQMGLGITWGKYLSEVVPALCTAGGHALAEVAAAWDCHQWDNCPMAIAFDVHRVEDVPPLYRKLAREFVHFFDAGLIPNPIVGAADTAACPVKE